MKKIKSILLVLFVAAILMGAGYAAWTDKTTVTGTIGTGTMKMDITDATATPALAPTTGNVEISTDLKSVTYTFENVFPTEEWSECVWEFTNTGSIPVKFNGITFNYYNPEDPMWDKIDAEATITWSGWSGSVPSFSGKLGGLGGFIKLAETAVKALDPEIAKDDVFTVNVRFRLPISADNDTQDQDVSFNFVADWKQFNQ